MNNPIIVREFINLLRQPRTVFVQCALAIGFLLLIALRWPTDGMMALSGSRSHEIFRLFAYALLGAILLFLPVFPATSFVQEKKRGTLALLLNTPLGPWRIYGGKLLATLALAALLTTLTLPAAAACFALGGVSLVENIGGVYLILALTALEISALALFVSLNAATTDAAVRWTYAAVLCLSVISLVPHYFFVGTGGPTGEIVTWLRCASPFAALMERLGDSDLGGQGVASNVTVMTRFALLSLGGTVLFSLLTVSRLNHRIFDRPRPAGKIVNDQSLAVRLVRRLVFIVDPNRRSGYIGPLTNPVMIKEFRCRKFGRLHWLLRLVSICAVLSLALSILTTTRTIEWDVATIGGILVVMQVALLIVITPSLTAGLISNERETGGWVLLQMTPMSAFTIVTGKLLSVLLTLVLVLFATLPGYLVMIYIEPGLRQQVQRVVLCLVLTTIFAMLSSAAIGSLFNRTAPATTAAYTLLLSICAFPLLVWMGRDAPFGHAIVEAALSINPIATALTVIRVQGFRDYELIPLNWWILGAGSLISLAVLFWQTIRLTKPQ